MAPDGRIVTRRTYAVRVVTRDGEDAAAIREVYTTGTDQIRMMRGWVLVEGEVVELGRDAVVDLALADNDVYNEVRLRVLRAGKAALPGVVFGAETETVERSVFAQFEWSPQQSVPVRSARRILTLPPGSRVRTLTFNGAPFAEAREGMSWVWSVRDLPGIEREPAAPPLSSLTPRLAVTYDLNQDRATAFDTWESVSEWLDGLATPRSVVTPVLQAKARELTAGAATDLDRVRALAQYIQSVQYISIQTGLGRGGGYTPHAAADVLTKNYGDCKDKANLLRVLLSTVGIRAHLVTVYSGDPDYVRPDWPSPQQFNHAIVAIALEPPAALPALSSHPTLGSLLFFDPTNEHTPVGELPTYLQGSHGLIVAGRDGTLVRMPTSAAGADRSSRVIEGVLDANGGMVATLTQSTIGGPASTERQLFKSLSADEYTRVLTAEVRRQVPGAGLAVGKVGDDPATNRFDLVLKVEASGYAQIVQNRLLIIRPPEMTRIGLPQLGGEPRTLPVLLDSQEDQDTFELVLPSGITVDEMPPPRTMTTRYGRFTVSWDADGTRVVRRVSLQVTRGTVPASSSHEVRTFVNAFREAEREAVVLVRR